MACAAPLLLLLGVCVGVALGASSHAYYTIYSDGASYTVKAGKDTTNGIAWGYVDNKVNKTGWAELSIAINANHIVPDAQAMFAAGYLEGYLTQEMIWQSYPALIYDIFGDNYTLPEGIVEYVQRNFEYLQDQVSGNPNDPYWIHVGLIVQQLTGVQAGYHAIAPSNQQLDLLQIALLNMNGDLEELVVATHHTKPANGKLPSARLRNTHCSGLVKLTPDYRELYAAHTTWESFVYLLRVFKQYDFPLTAPGTASTRVMFSSYPGLLSSVDDFYLTDQKLVIIETTNGILNVSLYELLTPKSVFSWMRVLLANRMSTAGQQWCELFSQQNSGTYNNQWFVVDYKLFAPGQPLLNNTFWVLEQIPGYCHFEDMTLVLSYGYWPSYNEPFFNDIWVQSGFAANEKKNGPSQSYNLDPRANIFRRDQGAIIDLDGMKAIMQYNDWENDPYSLGDSCEQISCRLDLEPDQSERLPFGGVDSKIASVKHVNDFNVEAISGPTHQQQPAFSWAAWPKVPRLGQPEVFNFNWTTISFPDESNL